MGLRTKPALLTQQQVGWRMGLHEDAVSLLAKLGHLPAVGKAQAGTCRFFSAVRVEELARDEKWLAKAVGLVRAQVARKNWAARVRRTEAATNNPAETS